MASASSSVLDSVRGHPAPYGRACTNCSRVKSKCFYRADGSGCERCHRLKKYCQTSVSIRKRNFKKNSGSRAAQLEEKIDDIVSLLRSQATIKELQTEPPLTKHQDTPLNLDTLLQTGDSASTPSTNAFLDSPTTFAGHLHSTPTGSTTDSNIGQPPSSIDDDVAIYKISNETAKTQLDTFRRAFLPFFPFIHIPEMMGPSDLRRQKPFLWLVIMSLTTKLVKQQRAMGETIRRIVSQRVVAEHERSMDILLGLICYLAWFQYHKKDRLYLIMWTQLAVALVFELGIHKPSPRDEGQLNPKYSWLPPRWPATRIIRTSEERRAVIGVFLLTSMVWTSLRQIEPLRWTASMDDYVRVLNEEKETDLDILLIAQAKYQVITNQITSFPVEQAAEGESSKVPPPYFVKATQLQLQDIKKNLPVEMKSNKSALLCMYGMEIVVKEAFLTRPKVRDQTGLSDLQRLEGLDSILTAIERWFELFFDVPVVDWIGTTYAILSQFSHCVILLFKLTSLDEPDWDRNEVMKRANLIDILERLAQRLDSIPPLLGLVDSDNPEDTGIFFKSSRLIRALKTTFSAEMAQNSLQMDVQPNFDLEAPEFMGESFTQDDIDMFIGEDPWWRELLLVQGTVDL